MTEFILFTAIYASCWLCYLASVKFKIPEGDIGLLIFANGLPFSVWIVVLAELINK